MPLTRTIKAIPPFIAIAAICVFFKPVRNTIEQLIFLFNICDVDSIKGYILSFGIWAPIVSFFLMIFQSIIAPLPAFLITFSNAALFGWIKGALLSWFSAMVGAALCFAIARSIGREVTEKLTHKYALEKVDTFFENYGKHTILIARLLPFISFDIVSYAAGLTSINFWPFFWATGIGHMPATLIYSYAGRVLTGGTRTVVTGILVLLALSAFTASIKKMWSSKQKNQEPEILNNSTKPKVRT